MKMWSGHGPKNSARVNFLFWHKTFLKSLSMIVSLLVGTEAEGGAELVSVKYD